MTLFNKETEGEYKFIRRGEKEIYVLELDKYSHTDISDRTEGKGKINDAGFLMHEDGSVLVDGFSESLNIGTNPEEREKTRSLVNRILRR